MDARLQHLELIQGVVGRLAGNSFRVKGWTVALVFAGTLLLARDGRAEVAFAVAWLALVFWGLDGYFLWQERLFRALYDHVRQIEDAEINLSMDVRPFKTCRPRNWLGATLSRTLVGYYGSVIAFALGIAMLLT